jgi:hypothetical protein
MATLSFVFDSACCFPFFFTPKERTNPVAVAVCLGLKGREGDGDAEDYAWEQEKGRENKKEKEDTLK